MKRVIILLLTVILLISSGCGIEAERVKIINVALTQESYAFAIAKENNDIKNAVN